MDTAEAISNIPAATDDTPRLGLLIVSLCAAVALADICFWSENPGLSVGVFFLGLAALLLLNRSPMPWTGRTGLLVALIVGAAAESAVDLCFSTGLVLVCLIVALAGETYYAPLRSGWSRWSEGVWTMMKAPARWICLMIAAANQLRGSRSKIGPSLGKAARLLWVAVPGLVITFFFAAILGNGNALFAKFVGDWANALGAWLLSLHLDFPRGFFWAFVAIVVLPLLWPSPAPKAERIWTKEFPPLPELTSAATARLQSAITLALLNGLFCFVNTIDAVYLWAGQKLPAGINPSSYVHEGVASLVMAVIFSAVLLAGLFQQTRTVSAWTPLRILGLLWITQNLVLLAGVFLRVKLYVDACDLTVTRVNLVLFLALVATGFLLLAIHVWYRRTLGWLLNANMLATFWLFYAVQFLDTGAFVARYNVDLWLKSHETRNLDLDYLKSLGPPAFDAMQTVATASAGSISTEAAGYLGEERKTARDWLSGTPWQGWQLREMRCYRKLLAATQP